MVIVAMLAVGSICAAQAARTRGGTRMLGAIPAKSLFCIRINNFDGTLDAANAFLKDIAPASFDAKTAVFSKLGSVLGDKELKGINKKGNIAIFAVNVPSDSAKPGPMGNMFIGALLSVTEYEDFISGNSNFSEPDEQGISTITINGQPRGLATNFRRLALLSPPNTPRENLIKVKEMLARRRESLRRSLSPDERRQASTSPIWIYLNVKQGSQMIQPMVMGGLQKMKAELEKAQEKGEGPPMNPAGIVSFYSGILKTVLNGTENVTVSLTPSAEACKVSMGLKPVPDSTMAAIVGKPLDGDLGHMLGYLEDGAIFNMAAKIDRESFKTSYIRLIKLMGEMMPGGISEADIKQLKELLTNGIDAMGDSIAVTFGGGADGPLPFNGKYVIEIRDRAAFEEVLDKELKLMEEGGIISNLYKGFGMEMNVEINHDAGSYKGDKIGAAKVVFKAVGGNEMQTEIFKKMFGDGLDYCWAFEKGNCLYTVGGDADKTIRELIDQVRAGGPKEIGSQMKTALKVLDNSDKADVVGTFNFVRYMRMAAGFIAAINDVDMPELDTPTESSVAFAGRTTEEGKLSFNIVMPKKHLKEIKHVFKTMIPQIEKQQREMKEKQSSGQS
jgi:hypothetical protein